MGHFDASRECQFEKCAVPTVAARAGGSPWSIERSQLLAVWIDVGRDGN